MMPTPFPQGARSTVPAVDVRALTKIFGAMPGVQDVTFSVSSDELVAITGAPGSGKTTLLKLIAGHLTPSGGRIRIRGLDPRTSRLALTSHIGYVPQIRPVFGAMRPHDLLDFCGRARPIAPHVLERHVRDVIAACELADHLAHPCGSLEAHVRIRVALAQALLHAPGLLLLDDIFRDVTDAESSRLAALIERLRGRAAILIAGDPVPLVPFGIVRHLRLDAGRLGSLAHTSPLPLAASS